MFSFEAVALTAFVVGGLLLFFSSLVVYVSRPQKRKEAEHTRFRSAKMQVVMMEAKHG